MRPGIWTPGERVTWAVGYSVLTVVTWWCWDRAAARHGPAGPLVFWLVATITSLALVATGSLRGAAVASWLAAGCGGALLVNIVRPRAGACLTGPGATVFAPTIASLWFVGPNSGDMALWMMFVLAASAPAALLGELAPIKRLAGWKHAFARAGLAAIPGIIVLAVALPQAKKDAEDNGYDAEVRQPGNLDAASPV
jgi:hypothetical protein